MASHGSAILALADPWTREQVLEIFNNRITNNLPTIVGTGEGRTNLTSYCRKTKGSIVAARNYVPGNVLKAECADAGASWPNWKDWVGAPRETHPFSGADAFVWLMETMRTMPLDILLNFVDELIRKAIRDMASWLDKETKPFVASSQRAPLKKTSDLAVMYEDYKDGEKRESQLRNCKKIFIVGLMLLMREGGLCEALEEAMAFAEAEADAAARAQVAAAAEAAAEAARAQVAAAAEAAAEAARAQVAAAAEAAAEAARAQVAAAAEAAAEAARAQVFAAGPEVIYCHVKVPFPVPVPVPGPFAFPVYDTGYNPVYGTGYNPVYDTGCDGTDNNPCIETANNSFEELRRAYADSSCGNSLRGEEDNIIQGMEIYDEGEANDQEV